MKKTKEERILAKRLSAKLWYHTNRERHKLNCAWNFRQYYNRNVETFHTKYILKKEIQRMSNILIDDI